MSYQKLFVINLMFAAGNFGIGGVNILFGCVSLLVAALSWRDWYLEECVK